MRIECRYSNESIMSSDVDVAMAIFSINSNTYNTTPKYSIATLLAMYKVINPIVITEAIRSNIKADIYAVATIVSSISSSGVSIIRSGSLI